MNTLMVGLFPFLCAFAFAAAAGPVFIPWLKRLKFGQEIREEGPAWHQKKSGTPTMGGLMFITATAISLIVTCIIGRLASGTGDFANQTMLLLAVSAGFGAIGFADDFIKVVKKRNLGLKALPKFLLQIAITVTYILVLIFRHSLTMDILIPFTSISFSMPMWLYVVFAVFVVAGTVNAVNLTDGLDGLASSVTIPVCLFFAFSSYKTGNMGIFVFGLAVTGALLGFLLYNKYPAKVFMGDTGSLFLGGAVVTMAIAMRMHLYLIVVGFIYFAEALSVIIQVTSFKLTGKRVFKMSPIHHHFEMCGWREVKIVAVFTAVTVILCLLAYFA